MEALKRATFKEKEIDDEIDKVYDQIDLVWDEYDKKIE
mgnify:CR=1 FL=1